MNVAACVGPNRSFKDYIGEHSRHKGGQIAKDVLWAGMEMCVLWKRMNQPWPSMANGCF
jgi:hypothetical protein